MSCREPIAEEVKDKERANFCEYFAVKTGAHSTLPGDKTQAARIQLEALFGGGSGETGNIIGNTDSRSEADIAREQLEQLFGSGERGDI